MCDTINWFDVLNSAPVLITLKVCFLICFVKGRHKNSDVFEDVDTSLTLNLVAVTVFSV